MAPAAELARTADCSTPLPPEGSIRPAGRVVLSVGGDSVTAEFDGLGSVELHT